MVERWQEAKDILWGMARKKQSQLDSHPERYVYMVNIIKHLAHKNSSFTYRLCSREENLT